MKAENIQKGINPRWVGFWMNVIFFELLKKLPLHWVHVPRGNASDRIAPAELQVNVPIRYPQKEQNLCFIKSLASALYYIGLKTQAVDIDEVSGDYAGLPLDLAYKLVQQHMKKYVRIIGVAPLTISGKLKVKIPIGGKEGIK